MNHFPLRVGLAAVLALWGGLAPAAPLPDLDKDPAGFLRFYARYVQTAPSPEVRAIRRNVAAGPAALARERALARQEGLAVFPAQLNRPLPPDDQNAAPLYRKAEALRRGKLRLPNYAETLSAHYAYTPAQLARVQKIYDDNSEVIALLHQAADRPQCVFARDWTKDTFNYFPQFAGMRETARELKTESILLAAAGRYAEAVTNQTRGYRVAEHVASAPILVSYLVAVAINAITDSGMQDILTLAGPNADVDAQVGQAVTEGSARLSLRRGLSGEAALGDASFSLLRRGGPAALGSFLNDTPAPPRAAAFTPQERHFYANLLDAAEANYLHQMRALVHKAGTPGEAAFARAGREAQTPAGDLTQDVVQQFLPLQFDTLNALPEQDTVSRAIIRAAAAVLAARARTGAYPAVLPGAFPDPYNLAKPLGYRREGAGGFVVFSVGPDGKDDGGRPGDRAGYVRARNRFRYPAVPVPVLPEDQR